MTDNTPLELYYYRDDPHDINCIKARLYNNNKKYGAIFRYTDEVIPTSAKAQVFLEQTHKKIMAIYLNTILVIYNHPLYEPSIDTFKTIEEGQMYPYLDLGE